MKLITALCLVDWICFINAAAPLNDNGLIVSRSPFFWFGGGIDIYQGNIEQFTTSSDITPKEYDLQDNEDISSLRSDPNNGRLIYSDFYHQRLMALERFDTSLNDGNITARVIHEGMSDTYHGRIAYDWLTGNLYWTDNKYNWIVVQNVDHPDMSSFKILIHEGVKAPTALAIDPLRRYLFWAEHGYNIPIIIRSDLLGGNRKTIRSGVQSVTDMVADHEAGMIYWVDNSRLTLERCDYDGNNSAVLYYTKTGVYLTAVTSYKNLVCILDYYYEDILCVNKISGTVQWSTKYGFSLPWGMDVYSIDNHPQAAHPCQFYRCSDICINSENGATCVCREGYETDTNNPMNCVASHIIGGKSLLVTNGMDVCMYDIRVLTGYKDNATCFTQWNGTITFMAVDANRSKLFFYDQSKSEIYRYDLKTTTSESLVTTAMLSGLQYDWIGNNLFWSESDTGTIKVASALTAGVIKTEVNGLDNPRNLEFYPHGRKMFWIAGTENSPIIQSYSFDTKTLTTVLNRATLSNPRAICYNDAHEKLYYVDKGYLNRVNADGSSVETPLVVHSSNLLLCYKDYAVTFAAGDFIKSNNIYDGGSGTTFTIDTSDLLTVTAMTAFDPNLHRKEKNACETNNGGCEHICFATSYTGRECQCSFGYELENNGVNCTTKPKMSNFALTVDFLHKEIFQVDINNGSDINAIDLPRPADPVAATYFDQHIYWSDYQTDKLHRSNMTGGNTSTIYTMELHLCFSLAVDPSTGNVYYAGLPYTWDSIYSYIAVVHPGTSKHKKLVDGIEHAGSIALYPSKGLMFWIAEGFFFYSGVIGTASMDGSKSQPLISIGLAQPISIAIGYQDNKIYWTDSFQDSVYYADLDGSNRGSLYTDVDVGMNHIAVDASNVFYTAHKKKRVTKLNKGNGKPLIWMNKQPEMGRLESLDIYADGYSVPVHVPCNTNNGLCSTFCLPRSEIIRTCACEDGVELQEDKHTCVGVLKCPMMIPNGTFEETCMPYKDKTCGFKCNTGFSKTTDNLLLCSVHSALPNTLQWDKDVGNLCAVEITTTVAPQIPGVSMGVSQTSSSGITSGMFAGLVIAIIVIFLIIILGLVLVIFRRRKLERYSNGKFVDSRNVPSTANITVRHDGDFDNLDEKVAYDQRTSTVPAAVPSNGMENPLYKEKNEPKPEKKNRNPYVTTIDVSKT